MSYQGLLGSTSAPSCTDVSYYSEVTSCICTSLQWIKSPLLPAFHWGWLGSSVISCSLHRMNVDIDPYLRHVKLYAYLFKICCKIIPFFLVLQSHTHQLVTLKWISVSYVQEQVFPLCKWFLVLIVHQHPVSFHRTAHQWASRIRKMVGRWSLKV